jgi:hypothetical protein
LTGNANLVPVVANGHVYVASYKQLAIFGPRSAVAVAAAAPAGSITATFDDLAHGNQVTGPIVKINGTDIVIRQHSGVHVTIDAKPAQDAYQAVPIVVGETITAEGELDAHGVLHAKTIVRAKPSPALWPPDQ